MATSTLDRAGVRTADARGESVRSLRLALVNVLTPLASLRLTVVLFALSIFLVFAGTLAQVDNSVWDVVDHSYFRVWFAFVDWQVLERLVQMFYPVQWNLGGGFPFPGGKLLGLALLANLFAAHTVRFKVVASGSRLWAGLALIAVGIVITVLAVQSGMNGTIESELSPAFNLGLWHAFRFAVGLVALGGAYLLAISFQTARRAEWYVLLAVDAILIAAAAYLFLRPDARLDDSGLRILWQLVKGLAAGIVLLAGCVLAFRQRAGIVLLHGGVALLMCSELWTGLRANEAQMVITEGQSANYASDIRTSEFAVVDRSDPTYDRVTVVPASLLEANVGSDGRIENANLPFTLQVHRWIPNADIREAAAGQSNPATAGAGTRYVADERAKSTGVDNKATADRPAAYVELFAKDSGQSLGTFLVGEPLLEQPVEVDGKKFDIALRHKRTYYPHSLTLKDFRFDRYTGTNTPKNYSSLVQLVDAPANVDREVLIWMNNPLRYAGSTYYQADFDPETEQTTVLQVVENPGWMVPYVACMLVATGMLAHFGITLTRFLRRRREEALRSASELQHTGSAAATSTFGRWFPALVVAIAVLYVGSKMRMPTAEPSEPQIQQFAKLPLAYQGRIKPYDTMARNTLQILSGRQEVIVTDKDAGTTKLPAIAWLLDAISGAKAAGDHRVFRIENLELLDLLKLEHREGSWRYSVNELLPTMGELQKQMNLAATQPENERSHFQKAVLNLGDRLSRYGTIIQSFQTPPISTEQDQLIPSLERVRATIARLNQSQAPQSVPPREATGRWVPLMEGEFQLLQAQALGQPTNPATVALATMLNAYANGDVATFNKQLADFRLAVRDYEKLLDVDAAELQSAGVKKSEILSQRRVDFEVFFNHFSPFYYAIVLYVFAFVLGVLSWLTWSEPLRRASIWLLWFTFALHTFALVGRIDISGRPPVTNLYSSAVFIGWACVLLALILESFYRLGLGNIVAAVIGFLTLLVAHFLSLDGDTFIVMQAVLDTQFWLATHVVCITLGYATTFVAGAFGILYVLLAHVFGKLNDEERRKLTRMTYGTLCFAIFFSFVGTVLGGLWADDSWGRFWGWDPKENGALIIVLYNALVLHARWGGMVGSRGLALLTIGGNIVTTWSWFGVNELGVGMHTYGASDSNTAQILLLFALSQVALIILGALPREWFGSLPTNKPTAAAG